MATLFFSADPKQAEPRLAFAEHIKEQLLLARQDPPLVSSAPVRLASPSPLLSPAEPLSTKRRETPRRVRFFSRRYLLNGGAIATVLLVIGGGLEWVREQSVRGRSMSRYLRDKE